MKKVLAIVFSVIFVFTFSTISFARQVNSIDAQSGETYSAYRLFTVEGFDEDEENYYLYKADENWESFITDRIDCFKVNADGYVTGWVNGADKDNFAKDALFYAEDNDVSPIDSIVAGSLEKINTSEITNNLSGYYLFVGSDGYIEVGTWISPVYAAMLTEEGFKLQEVAEGRQNAIDKMLAEQESRRAEAEQQPVENNSQSNETIVIIIISAVVVFVAGVLISGRVAKKKTNNKMEE